MVTGRWTLNGNLDYYVATNQTDPQIVLELAYKAPDGTVQDVGRFRLDLVALAEQEVVNRRQTPMGEVFDVQIVHRRGRFALQVREGRSMPLDRFAVRE